MSFVRAVMPTLSNTHRDCPATDEAIWQYISLEDPSASQSSLSFVCRAESSEKIYWVWSYESFGMLFHLVVEKSPDSTSHALWTHCFDPAPPNEETLIEHIQQLQAQL